MQVHVYMYRYILMYMYILTYIYTYIYIYVYQWILCEDAVGLTIRMRAFGNVRIYRYM